MLKDKRNKLEKRLNNITEKIVLDKIEEFLKREEFKDFSITEEKILEMAAYALNRLPAKYVTSLKGEVFLKTEELEQQYSADITSVVIKSIKKITENYNNDDE